MTGKKDFESYGGWGRYESPKSTETAMWARWKMNNVYLHNGARMSGSFYQGMNRKISGDATTTKSVSRSKYNVSYNGAAISKAVEEYNKTGVYDPVKWHRKMKGSAKNKISELPQSTAEVKRPPRAYTKSDQGYPDSDYVNFGSGTGGPGGGPAGVLGGGLSPMSPSNVGGIKLRGAGEALKHLGQMKGIAIDENNGRLVLISEDESRLNIPPLRMDEIVTVFRSVYENGAPFVSIDPDPENPEGPAMSVRHDKTTEGTYTGFVLFETDRLMKAYSLGYDNVTRKPLKSKIDNYQNLFDPGFSNYDDKKNARIWERFWIVPSEVNQRRASNRSLTLFDVPLKVKTQRMVLYDGKLKPAPDDTPSSQAQNFSKWFTKNYDRISREALAIPPEGSEKEQPVEVFAELRRIAVVTAIAEMLRDQGIPFPSWMRDYPVKPCDVPEYTPAITIEATEKGTKKVKKGSATYLVTSTKKQRIYGGVNLAPADKDVHIVKQAPEAESLAPDLLKKVASTPLLTPVEFKKNKKKYKAVILPGNNTQDLGANQLTAIDLKVPVQRDAKISLVRKFNSFFQPNGSLGNGWSFDLPQLIKQKLPIKRTGDATEYKIAFQLTSPLGSFSAYFNEIKHVPEVKTNLLTAKDSTTFLGIAKGNNKNIGSKTTEVLFRDGREWHFDDNGDLVAQIQKPLTVIYRRDNLRRIRRIEGWYGDNLRADIKTEYDRKGRIIKAQGSDGIEVNYEYDSAGFLKLITRRGDEKIEHEYKDGLVTMVKLNGNLISKFEYGEQGGLISEQFADKNKTTYDIQRGTDTIEIKSISDYGLTVAEYDTTFRPLKKIFTDGAKVQWKYDNSDSIGASVKLPNGKDIEMNSSSDGKHVTWFMPEGDDYTTEYDDAGRLISIHRGNQGIMSQKWHSNGLLKSIENETVTVQPKYSKDLTPTGVIISASDEKAASTEWLKAAYDLFGRINHITDYTGSDIKIG